MEILDKIAEFEEKKLELYTKTKSVQKFLQNNDLEKSGVVVCE